MWADIPRHWRHAAMVLVLLLATASQAQAQTQRLPACPDTPNCVSSQAESVERRVEPLQAGSDATEARERLTAVLNSLPRVAWQQASERVIHAQFTSRLMRFTDDVEFHITDEGLIHVRSASRIGYSDLGANRARVEDLRQRLAPDVTTE
jgi:uncharacterized protein (DUF1499 family)